MSFVMHPAVRTRLKAEAALDGLTMTEKLHRLLCGAFNLHDLADRAPDYRDRSRSA